MCELKCPFCKKELKLIGEKSDSGYPIDEYVCSCPETAFSFGNTVMWNNLRVLYEKLKEKREDCELAKKELIRTRKALDVALKCLNGVVKDLPWVKRALDEIAALEQGEHFADVSKKIEQKDE